LREGCDGREAESCQETARGRKWFAVCHGVPSIIRQTTAERDFGLAETCEERNQSLPPTLANVARLSACADRDEYEARARCPP
jgi:hypothetical protein